MSGGGGQQGQDQDKDSYALLWIIAAIFVISAIIWHFWSVQLKWAFIALKKYEALAISFFVDNENVQIALKGLNMATPNNLTMDYASTISTFIGQYWMYPICFALIVMAVVMFKGHATRRFTKAYNMDTLVQQERDNWPQIAPVSDLELVEQEVDKGPWAMAMNPMQFARHHQLLKLEIIPDRKAMWRSDGLIKATVIREKATQVFASQLGPMWISVEALPAHTKAIYAAFLARIEHDTDACRAYLSKLASSAAKGTVDYTDTDVYLKKYGKSKAALLCQKHHAYVLSVMATMLELARLDGVLASADFLWIKPIDRRLWYVLNCVGRQVAVAEVGGIFAHWLAEKQMGRLLSVPMVEEAANALEKAVANMIYVPKEDEEIPSLSIN